MTEQRLGIDTKIRVDVPEARGFLNHPARVLASVVAVLLVVCGSPGGLPARDEYARPRTPNLGAVGPAVSGMRFRHAHRPLRTPLCHGANLYFQPDDWNCALFRIRRWSCERSAGWPGSRPGPPCESGWFSRASSCWDRGCRLADKAGDRGLAGAFAGDRGEPDLQHAGRLRDGARTGRSARAAVMLAASELLRGRGSGKAGMSRPAPCSDGRPG